MRRAVALSITGLGLLAATWVAARMHDNQLDDNAKQVRVGMAAREAMDILGPPSWQGRCGSYFPYGSSNDCAAELTAGR